MQDMNPFLVPLHLGWSREVAPKKNAAGQVGLTLLPIRFNNCRGRAKVIYFQQGKVFRMIRQTVSDTFFKAEKKT